MNIQDLISAKRKQIALLERHIQVLEQMAAEEDGFSTSAPAPPRAGRRLRRSALARRGAKAPTSRSKMIEAYLTEHPGPQAATEIATTLGLKPSDVHGAVRGGLKSGRIVRGKERGTYGLRSAEKATPEARAKSKRTRGGRSRRRTTKARPAASASQASA